MPNYSEGTSGIAYYLITLYHFTKDQAFLNAALAGAYYLLAVANKDNGGCMVFHSTQAPTMYYLGECNGPPGTGRLWTRLYQVTGNSTWLFWAEASAKSLVDHGSTFNWVYHTDRTDPFWNNVGLCDGNAASVEYFNYLYQLTNKGDHWLFADKVASNIISRGTSDGDGLKWTTVEWRTNPALSTGPQVGYMQGNAGLGSTFLGMYESFNKKPSSVRVQLPDSPYAFGFKPKPSTATWL